jgi:hypothetical protein
MTRVLPALAVLALLETDPPTADRSFPNPSTVLHPALARNAAEMITRVNMTTSSDRLAA